MREVRLCWTLHIPHHTQRAWRSLTVCSNFTEWKIRNTTTCGRLWDVADYQFHERKRLRNNSKRYSSLKHGISQLLTGAVNTILLAILIPLVQKFSPIMSLWWLVTPIEAGNTDDSSGGPKCSLFEGVNATFTAWFIAFTAWIAWKRPELSPLIRGTSKRPDPADPDAPTAKEKTAIKKWDELNTQLYGAVVSHVTASIQSTLHISHIDDGVGAITSLKSQFGAQSTGDRAEAMARVQRSYIDPRAKINVADVNKQYNEMALAVSDIISTGGAKLDDTLLISMFENALPTSYASIRQMVRYKEHDKFNDYYNDLLVQVKAEERSTQPQVNTAFSVQSYQSNSTSRAPGKGKGKGKGKGGRFPFRPGRGGGKGGYQDGYARSDPGYYPCFNCGRGDHSRSHCPDAQTTCSHCGAAHMSELCSKGPGGPMRDALTFNAKSAIDRATDRMSRGGGSAMNTWQYYGGVTPETMAEQVRTAYLLGKRSAAESASTDKPTTVSTSAGSSSNAPRGSACNAGASSSSMADLTEIDAYINNLMGTLYLTHQAPPDDYPPSSTSAINVIAYIDSQATNFVVPSVSYLSRVDADSPDINVETANGIIKPDAIGDAVISMFDDNGHWHTFIVKNVWAMSTCSKILYSQLAMREHGITHRLDEGYILFDDGSRKSVSPNTYAVELTLGASLSSHGDTSEHTEHIRKAYVVRSTIPQKLLWQRLGCPSERIWLNVCDVTSDHGLPPNPHLKHDFGMPEAVTRARARLLPFHKIRDPDQLPAPGSTIYMDFAGPMIPSFPHSFTYYCGAVDAGSGYSKVLPCHRPTKEVARACMELLTSDIRMLMGLSHAVKPHVVVSDQGSQFMSQFFQDYLSSEQIVFRPAVTYTPQQNSFVERMWGTRFAIARTLLKMANLGPIFHPFAIQTSNWICNRLPQPWRSYASAVYILSRRLATLAYLKVFGSLARVTIPWSKRVGDKHFADRGLMGIYLGPSEKSPGSIVYVPSARKFFTTRDIICYEDIRPGVKGLDSSWKDLPVEPADMSVENSGSSSAIDTSSGETPSLAPRYEITSSVDVDLPPPESIDPNHELVADDPDSAIADVDVSINDELHSIIDHSDDPTAGQDQPIDDTRAKRRLPSGDSGDPNDPSSRQYRRELPKRSTRYTGVYYVNPTDANIKQTIDNAVRMVMHSHGVPLLGDVVICESSIGGMNRVFMVTSTADMGDIVIPRTYRQALESPESNYWKEAITRELNGLVEIGTFEFVKLSSLPQNANVMRCHMVFTIKRQHDGSIEKFKCRLVADGNTQRWGIDFDKVFSTVAKLSTLRLILAIAAAFDYDLSSVDIRQAYLQATISEDLFMAVPPGMPNTDSDGDPIVAKLKRSLYGLKQAGREWHSLFSATLCSWGFHQSTIDTCMFTYRRGDSILWLVIWVDDCIIISNDSSLRSEFVSYLSSKHPTEDKGELQWVLQVRVIRDRAARTLALSQELYIQDLVRRHGQLLDGLTRRFDSPYDSTLVLSHDQCPSPNSPESVEMEGYREVYMSLIGAYLWLANVSRPELCYIAAQLARFVSNPGVVHYRAALRVLIYLQSSADRHLVFRPNVHLPLRAFVDADWSTQFSVSGGLVDYMGSPIHWLSRSQRSVSMSSTESEFFATSLIVKEIIFFRDLLSDLGLTCSGATEIFTDNRGVVDLAIDPVSFKKTKHILRAAHFVRDLALRRVVKLNWIAGTRNPADLFTKAFALSPFRKLVAMLSALSTLP